jgi:hypothetical protein
VVGLGENDSLLLAGAGVMVVPMAGGLTVNMPSISPSPGAHSLEARANIRVRRKVAPPSASKRKDFVQIPDPSALVERNLVGPSLKLKELIKGS